MENTHKTAEKNTVVDFNEDLIIIGSGPAGYTAGIYASRAGLKPLLITGNQLGGQLVITNDIENYPGFEKISGYELMDKMRKHAESLGVRIVNDTITKVDFENQSKTLYGKKTYTAKAVIIATGASAKWLGLESEKKYRGHGVSACAVCDGFFYAGQTVAVVGGGNTALEDAQYLSNMCQKVYLIHRRSEFRADKIEVDRVTANPKIELVLNSTVEEVLGDEQGNVNTIKVKNLLNSNINELSISGLFVAIGHHPNTDIFKNIIPLDDEGYITSGVPCKNITTIRGVFAAGDVISGNTRQAVVAAASGCEAAIAAKHYLTSLK
jgi:thioredoxin reductase (NADPH)